MSLKLSELNESLRARIEAQLAAEDAQAKRNDVRRVEAYQSQQAATQTLVRRLSQCPRRETRLVCVVSLVAVLRKPFDDDNLVASLKPLRDAISASLVIDDGDKRIRFQYGQMPTQGREGVLVHIEVI